MLLAARFGGTPWAWRGSPAPDARDWGTALGLLEQEQEQAEEQRERIEQEGR